MAGGGADPVSRRAARHPRPRPGGTLTPRCHFCGRRFPENGELQHLPLGRRFAYDPGRGRLWAVCDACWRWSLLPQEERAEALEELERTARDAGRLMARTANVALLQAPGLTLVRVGPAQLAEQAWWRYGQELRLRRRSAQSPGTRLLDYAWGALHYAGELLGVSEPEIAIDWKDQPRLDILRWRRFGWAAWHGRVSCRYCNSTLRALRYDLSWWVYPVVGSEGRVEVGVPCPRCDPWTPANVYRLVGDEAEMVLRRCLAYQNVAGAPEARIHEAARAIEAAGAAGAFVRRSAGGRESLWKMRGTGALALEIALGESAERRRLAGEARAMDILWRQEEELAAISDEELTPPYGPVRRILGV